MTACKPVAGVEDRVGSWILGRLNAIRGARWASLPRSMR
jgi:hypothetical protein